MSLLRFTHVRPREFLSLFAAAASGWSKDNALRLSAALAYYSIFSLAPLLILGVSAAGYIFGEKAASGDVTQQISQFAGDRAAQAIQALVVGTGHKSTSLTATVLGIIVMFFGASGAFSELKAALNTIWGVELKPGRPLLAMVREKFFSFIMVLCVGFLLLVSVLFSTTLAAFEVSWGLLFTLPSLAWQGADLVFSLIIVTLLFAVIFKVLPNVCVRWSDVWIGSGVTSLLFAIGKFLIGFYLGASGVVSYYGAAGSAIIILLWVYYSACILFFGAEFTKASVLNRSGAILPDQRANLLPRLSSSVPEMSSKDSISPVSRTTANKES